MMSRAVVVWTKPFFFQMAARPATLLHRAVAALEALIAADPGGRGIAHITLPNQLLGAARDLAAARSVLVLTGFPCRVADAPPTESDGPPGAVALVAAALRLGKRAALVTDECNAAALQAVAAAAGCAGHAGYSFHAFPPAPSFGPAHGAQLRALAAQYDHAVAIERAGRAADGGYYTMGGVSMAHLVAPLDALLTDGCACGSGGGGGGDPPPRRRTSTGIGDGGNEAGMGRVAAAVAAHIRLGALIGSVTPADSLITAGVSNWGGWALVAAVECLLRSGGDSEGRQQQEQQQQQEERDGGGDSAGAAHPPPLQCVRLPPGLPLGGLLPTPEAEVAIGAAMVAAGVRDGITGACDASVDGLPPEAHLAQLERLRGVVVGAFGGAAVPP